MDRIGPYEVVSEIARGGMGVVYRARRGPGGAPVALKVLSPQSATTEQHRARLQREVEALRQVEHPGVVRLLEADASAAQPWLALELIEGESLGERLRLHGPLEPDDAARLGRALAKALEHCHQHGVLHRDLKPDNVLLRPDGSPVLTDFGLTREVEIDQSRSALTRTGTFMGTPGYWSPEQAHGQHAQVGPPTDVYGLGATLFAVLTGQPPYSGADLLAVLEAMDLSPPRVATLRPGVPRDVDDLLARCLARDPAERPSLKQVAAQLGRPRPARASTGPSRLPVAVAAGVLLCGGLAAVGLILSADAPARVAQSPTPAPSLSPGPSPEVTPSPVTSQAPPAPAVAPTLTADAPALLAQAVEELWSPGTERGAELAQAALEAGGLTPQESTFAQALLASTAQNRDRTLELLNAVLADDPENALARHLRGYTHYVLGDKDAAFADWVATVARAPDRATAWNHMGIGHLTVKDDEPAALEAFERAVELDPDLTPAHYHLGRVREALGQQQAALESYSRALELDPDHDTALYYRAEIRFAQGDVQGALADVDEQLRRVESAAAFTLRGRIRASLDDLGSAEADYDRALARNPRHLKAVANRAAVRERRGNIAGAMDDTRLMLEILPPDSPYRAPAEALLRKHGGR
jgi:serine/threonine-protein kinase